MDRDLKRLRWQELPTKLKEKYKEVCLQNYYIKVTIAPEITLDLFSNRKYENIVCFSNYDIVYNFNFNIDTLETEYNSSPFRKIANKLIEQESSVILNIIKNHFSPNNSINFIKDL